DERLTVDQITDRRCFPGKHSADSIVDEGILELRREVRRQRVRSKRFQTHAQAVIGTLHAHVASSGERERGPVQRFDVVDGLVNRQYDLSSHGGSQPSSGETSETCGRREIRAIYVRRSSKLAAWWPSCPLPLEQQPAH